MVNMYSFKRYVLLNVVMLSIGNKCEEVQYEYTIEIPKYQCDMKESSKIGLTTIRLQGKDAQKLQYEFTVNYKNISMCTESQRCTLTAWRAVRNLEKYLHDVSALKSNLQEININNTLLVPGIQYLLNVRVTNNGINVGNKEFLLECTNSSTISTSQNGSANHSQQTSHTSLLLLGSNITYRDIIYFLNAETVDCYNNCKYYFKWEILDDSENLILSDPTKGSELQISFEMLNKTDQYIIRCSLMSIEKSVMVATALQNINVVRREMVLKLAVLTLVVGLKKPFQIHGYIKDVDNPGKINIEWLCKSENGKQCLGFDKSQSNYQEKLHSITLESNGFLVVGRYNISLIVRRGNVIKQQSCEIRVELNGFAEIEVDNVDDPIDPSKPIELPVYVSNLIANCMLQWMSVKTPNYAYIDLQIIPGKVNSITNITLAQDEFLNEIDEFSNDTTDIDYNLKFPPPKGNWKGLKGNTSYLFRLNVTCPVFHNDEDDEDSVEDAEPLLLQNFVSLYADIVLQVDPSPILNALEVIPKQGIALKTIFKFVYQENGSMVDNPVLYKFGYFLNNEIIFVSHLLGVTNTKNVLPYIDSGVKTVLEGCNSNSLCAQIFGPVIITEMPLVSEEDQTNLKEQLRELIIREEYYKAFTYFLAILQTYNNSNDETVSKSMQYYISNLTSNEIKRLLMLSADGDTKWRVPANNLIKNVGILLKSFSASGVLLNNIVALRNELSRRNTLKLRIARSIIRHPPWKFYKAKKVGRFKREIEKMTLDEVKSYLVISELIITTSPDKRRVRQERENLLNQIDKFMHGLCATLYEKSQTMNLELRTMILSMEKINKNSFNRYTHILYTGNSWNTNGRIKLGKCFTEKLKFNDQLCLGKAVLKNYLNKKGIVYMIKIYSADSDEQLLFEDMVCDSVLVLPVDEKQVTGKEARCALWKRRWIQSECKTLQVTSNIQCNCNNLGYYAVEYVVPVSTTTMVTVATTSAVLIETTTTTTVATVTEPVPTAISTDKEMLNVNEEQTTISIELPTSSIDISPVIDEASSNMDITNIASDLTTVTSSVTTDSLDNSVDPTVDMTNLEVLSTSDVLSTIDVVSTADELINDTLVTTLYASEDEDVVYYCIIGFSIAGIAMLIYGIKQLLHKDESIPNTDFPKYALVDHPEMLQDLPTST